MTAAGRSSTNDVRRDVAATLLPGFVGTTLPGWLRVRLEKGLGGVCIFGPNVRSAEQLAALTAEIRAANPSAVIAIDEEGGDVTRLFYDIGSPYPGNAVLGRIDDLEYTGQIARRVGTALRGTGCTMTFAPDVDINSNSDNPVIGVRSFGTEPDAVARHSAAWTRGVQEAGVAACAKHFPGHGDTSVDSHLALPVIDRSLDALRQRELVPFRAAIEAGARAIMTSHILLPQIDRENPATLSPRVIDRLLRDELAFDGIVVSDALDMTGASGVLGIPEAAVRALVAGCDLLCIGTENTDAQLQEIEDAILAAVDAGRLSEQRIREAAHRVRALADQPLPDEVDVRSGDAVEPDAAAEEARVSAAFAISERAEAWFAETSRGGDGVGSVVRVETVANIAVGVAPWGLFAVERMPGAWLRDAAIVGLSAADDGLDPSSLVGPVLVVGKDIHRHAFARDAIDRLRSARSDVLVVDMGWPSDDRAYADIATFGASRLVGSALAGLIADGISHESVSG